MRILKCKKVAAGIVALALFGAASAAVNAAVTIDLATAGVGYIRPTLLGSAFDITALDNMIKVYNGTSSSPISGENFNIVQGSTTPNPSLPIPLTLGSDPAGGTPGNGQPSMDLDLGAGGYEYLVTQWDGPNGANAIYWIGGLSGIIHIVNDLGDFTGNSHDSDYGLSHTYVVPEPTTMIAGALLLLPFGASTLRNLRRRAS
jgi:hypothetical protein